MPCIEKTYFHVIHLQIGAYVYCSSITTEQMTTVQFLWRLRLHSKLINICSGMKSSQQLPVAIAKTTFDHYLVTLQRPALNFRLAASVQVSPFPSRRRAYDDPFMSSEEVNG
eukprot:scaffold5141_cov169-Amphora_coffeaeformis.AAC.1